jgi:hypothetical protein
MGLILAWKNRDTPTEFSEGRYVSAAIMTDTELLIIGVPILIITNSNPISSFVVKVLFIFLSVGATTIVFFYPKFAILNGLWGSDSQSANIIGKQPINRRSVPKEGSVKESQAGSFKESRLSRRPSSPTSVRQNSMFRSGSTENMKGITSYVKQSSWYGGQTATVHESEKEDTGFVVSVGGPTEFIPILQSSSSKRNSGGFVTPAPSTPATDSGDVLEGDHGGHATMFFGNRVVQNRSS